MRRSKEERGEERRERGGGERERKGESYKSHKELPGRDMYF